MRVFLGQLAVDKSMQGRHLATALMQFALVTALRAADFVGSIAVITHPLDDDVRSFYTKWGFKDLPFDPRRAMMVRMVDLRKAFMGEAATGLLFVQPILVAGIRSGLPRSFS